MNLKLAFTRYLGLILALRSALRRGMTQVITILDSIQVARS